MTRRASLSVHLGCTAPHLERHTALARMGWVLQDSWAYGCVAREVCLVTECAKGGWDLRHGEAQPGSNSEEAVAASYAQRSSSVGGSNLTGQWPAVRASCGLVLSLNVSSTCTSPASLSATCWCRLHRALSVVCFVWLRGLPHIARPKASSLTVAKGGG